MGYNREYYSFGSKPAVYNWQGRTMEPSRSHNEGLGGLPEMAAMSALVAPPVGLVAGLIYASRSNKSKLLYGLAGWVGGAVVLRLAQAALIKRK